MTQTKVKSEFNNITFDNKFEMPETQVGEERCTTNRGS